MAVVSSSVVLQPRIIPAYSSSSFSCSNKAHNKNYYTVASPRPSKVSSPILSTRPKASPTVFEIVRTISGKDDREIQADLNRLQHAWQILKGFLLDTILVLLLTNPIILVLSDAMVSDRCFIRWCTMGASFGAFVVLKECAKVLWKSQPVWASIIYGYLIYKASMCNIALNRNGQHYVWLEYSLLGLCNFKYLADLLLLLSIPKLTPLDIMLALIDIIASIVMCAYYFYNNI